MQTVEPLIPALVVGGEHSFVVDKLASQLRRHGLSVAHHWEWKKKPKAFVGFIDVVFIVADMVSHSMNDLVRDMAYERNVPVIFGCRKWATNKERLERAGYPERVPEVPSTLLSVALPAAPTPVPEAETSPPPTQPSEENMLTDTFVYDTARLRNLYLTLLKEKPDISNKAAYSEALLRAPLLGLKAGAERPDLLADLRRELNIIRPKNTIAKKDSGVPTAQTSAAVSEVLAASNDTKAASKDVRELVQLLRVAMEAEGIESLSITRNAVKFRRVVVEEGDFDV